MLRIKPKMPSTRLKLMSNFSSTKTEISKTSLLMVSIIDNNTNIDLFIPNTKTVYIKFMSNYLKQIHNYEPSK
ncbi:hypothetical protein D3C85_1385010 [compost metagenome]